MSYNVELERQAQKRRMEALVRRLEKLNRDIIDTEIQIENEKLIGEQLAKKTRRFGLLGMLDDTPEIVAAPQIDPLEEAADDALEVEATELVTTE